ncbi:Purine nucleoside phosphorylase [Polyrhizophydium stewartii]|uniref:Purine nucleoside phosphorylase n=1 Tax=Polyrhizophydium stewartii TaxID=2732419 RepID=A0ABR4NFE0_9FUNG
MATPNSLPNLSADYFSKATYDETAAYLRDRLPDGLKRIQVGIVCGSGLGGLVSTLENTVEFEYKDIPHFATSTVAGHVGKLVFGTLAGKPAVCMVGRKHLYEGHSLLRTVFPIRVMQLLGATTLIVTNAAGGLNANFRVGDVMLIADHVSFAGLAGQNPLIGPNVEAFGPRFPPVSGAYDFDLRVLAVRAAHASGIPLECLREGTYVFVTGPSFETRAEARFLRDYVKADCVGMSTVPEVVVAKHCGLRVLGISLITNKVAVGRGRSALAAGLRAVGAVEAAAAAGASEEGDELQLASHAEVLATSAQRSAELQRLVRGVVELM